MAIIGKIREKSWLMLVLIGLALLAFIFTDYSKMNGNVESKYGFGTIDGEKIDYDAFNKAVDAAQLNSDRNTAQQNQPSTPVDRDRVWVAFTEKILLDSEFEKLGIDVSPNEFDAYLYGNDGFEVLPEFIQGFTDSITGLFNEKLLQSRIEQMETSEDPDVQQQWKDRKEYYIDKRKREKYFEILNQGVYITTLEAKNEYNAQKEVKNIAYVSQMYSSIPNSEVKVTDDQLKSYFEEHKNDGKYLNRFSSRTVRFFDIKILPSSNDSSKFYAEIETLKEKFISSDNDSLFVMKNSKSPRPIFVRQLGYRSETDPSVKDIIPGQLKASYPSSLDSAFKSASIGTVIGPYEENGIVKLAKVIDKKSQLLSVRHLLIAAQKIDTLAVEKAKAKVDSLMPLINKDNFEEMVNLYSEDRTPGQPVANGGKYENFVEGEMVEEFSDFAVNQPEGKIGYVQTQYGFHIIEVLERKNGSVPNLAIVESFIKPSQETIDNIDAEVDNIIYLIDDKTSLATEQGDKVSIFDTIAKENGYIVRPITIQENSPKVSGFSSAFAEDKILKLAFAENAKTGDLIDSPIKEKSRYVVAILSSIKVKGAAKFEDVKDLVERDFIEDKKAKRIASLMVGAKSLNNITKKISGASVSQAEVTFANPQIAGAGFEPAVVGALYSGLKDGELTVPLKGKAGVYVIQIEKTTKAPAVANYQAEKDQLLSGLNNQIQSGATGALVKKFNVVDNRRFFDTNIRR